MTLDFLVDALDWEANTDPHFKDHHFLFPIVDKASSGDGYTDKWVVYGTFAGKQLFSAKELTVMPGVKAKIKDNGASGVIVLQGTWPDLQHGNRIPDPHPLPAR